MESNFELILELDVTTEELFIKSEFNTVILLINLAIR